MDKMRMKCSMKTSTFEEKERMRDQRVTAPSSVLFSSSFLLTFRPSALLHQDFEILDKPIAMSGDQSLVVVAGPDPRHKSVLVAGSESEYVKLNVGGTLFYTTIGTLTKCDSMLR